MSHRNGAREVGLAVAALAVSVHFLELKPAIALTALAALVAGAGTVNLIGRWQPLREPRFPLVLPVVAAFSIAGLSRIVGPAIWLVAILPAGWFATAWIVDLELFGFFQPAEGEIGEAAMPAPVKRIRTRRRPESELPELVVEETIAEAEIAPHPMAAVIRAVALGLAFLGFVAVAGFVPGALAEPAQPAAASDMFPTIAAYGLVAGLIGYRLAALIAAAPRDRMIRLLAFLEYGAAVVVAAWILRSIELPGLLVPALLTLVVYLLTVLRESSEPILLNTRLLRQLVVLGLAGAVALVWGLLAR